jgi:hypothetical protein
MTVFELRTFAKCNGDTWYKQQAAARLKRTGFEKKLKLLIPAQNDFYMIFVQ